MNGWIVFGLFLAVWIGVICYGARHQWTATMSIGGGFISAIVLIGLGGSLISVLMANESTAKPPKLCHQLSWDGSVPSVEKYLRANLNDPKFERMEWSAVVKRPTGYMVRFKYRAKNSFGALVIQNQIFDLDQDCQVSFVADLE